MSPEPIVMLSALEHYLYCPRQCALIHVDGIWVENSHTVLGTRLHKRVDTSMDRQERGRRVIRSMPLYSERFGLSGRADAVEVAGDGPMIPVEYKSGRRHGRAAEVQMCAQAMCLEEMTGRPLEYGFVWYAAPRHKARVELSTELRELTVELIEKVRTQILSGVLPPAVADTRCRECQLQAMCMPGVVFNAEQVRAYIEREVFGCA